MKASLPPNENLRLAVLHKLAILDTPAEQSFDDVAQVAMQLCDVPIAVVSLVDTNRQWFKSCLGLDARETPRDVAFCAHAILSPEKVLVVENALEDFRFVDNDLVTGPPYIRFYAGAPLISDEGVALGTLCVIDSKPRKISEAQCSSLQALARQVINILRLRSANEAIKEHSARLQLIADKVPILIGELNKDSQYTFANKRHSEWLQLDSDSAVGNAPQDIFPPESKALVTDAINSALSGTPAHVEVQLNSGRFLDINYTPQIQQQAITGVFEVATDITERKIHLQVMEQERQRLEAIIEGTNIGTWEWNVINNTVVINERWANMLGYRLCDLGPITVDVWVSLLHPDDVQDSYASLQRHLSGETAFHDCKFRMRTKEGGWRWVHAHGKIVRFTPQGKPEIISGMHMDIHHSKTTYDLLCERENLLRSLLSNFPGAAYRRDDSPSQHIFFLSDAVAQLTGYAVETFMQQDGFALHSLIHPNDLESVNASIHSAIEQKTAFTLEYRIKRADGAWRYVQDFGRGVFDADNNLIYVDGFVWDIQSRKDSEAQTKLMTHKLSQLFEMAPLGIMQIHQSGKFIDTNPEISKITGYTREELKSMTFLDITPPEDIEKSKLATKDLNETGRFGPIEKHYQHKNGDLIAVEICGSEINTGLDDGKSWWTLVKDIREQRRISQMKSEFISTVSHELRTPLTSITGALGLITNNMLGALPDKAHAMLTIAYKNSQRLTLLINDLLDMEKLLAGKMYFDMQTQSLLPLIQQAVTENKAYADKYHVAFAIQCNINEPRANIDAFRFQQVINNFLSNAAKYSQANQTVDIVISQRVDKVRVAVHDYGAGISEEFKTRIFQKFSQADSSSTREKGGTGLGLAISKELVERMQGQIGFESQMGQGACFYAEFNLEQ